jgi:hypothetical protein
LAQLPVVEGFQYGVAPDCGHRRFAPEEPSQRIPLFA